MNIIPIISPLIFLALLGFVIAKKSWLSEQQLAGLIKATFAIFIPAFLFYRMATADLDSQLNIHLFSSFYLPVLICFALGFIVNHFWHSEHKKNKAASAVFALGSSYSNNVIVGLPVLLLLIGDKALPIIFLIVTFHSAMLFALTSAIASTQAQSSQTKNSWLTFIKQTLSNPLIVAILSGLAINKLGITLPDVISKSLQFLGQPAIPLALISLGASIAKYDIRGERKFIALASAIKLLVLPSLVYFTATYLFKLELLVVQVLVILSACPTGVNAYLLAQLHQVHRKAVASTVVASTVASVFTLPLWMYWLNLA
ncbi:AEC family transporter [Thalassotalea sp. M1531]|uniref:AEC family transporter n=1 Tax=Thalassotalea algicola TaxID=2716224 RepID=A0A7Y0LAR8_9GAMM|nr:AEC family transporter [Thalassotalea algicola]NMP31089.1 AEC family transporter [Thalassotalea algicola]